MEISFIQLKALVNKEFYQFFFFLVDLIDGLDPVKLKVKGRRDALSAILVRLGAALDREQASEWTAEIIKLDGERDSAFMGFVYWLRGLAYHPDVVLRNHAKFCLDYLKSHGKRITKLNLPSETAVLQDIVKDFKAETKLVAAATALKAQAYLNEIETKNNAFIDVYKKRLVETGTDNINEESFVSIKPEAIKAYQQFQKLILGRYEAGIEDKADVTLEKQCIEQVNALVEKFHPFTLPPKKEEDTPKTNGTENPSKL